MRNRYGFTLIELLVVIAIIAILAAILFPVFAQAREKARQITCASNLKQMGLALIQYNQDYDETFPQKGMSGKGGYTASWQTMIMPYLKSTEVFVCPSHQEVLTDYAGSSAPGSEDYVCNTWAKDNVWDTAGQGDGVFAEWSNPPAASGPNVNFDGITLASLAGPASTIALLESNTYSDMVAMGTCPAFDYSGWQQVDFNINALEFGAGNGNGSECGPWAGHTGLGNYLFCDGHVKALTPFQTTDASGGGSATVNMWARDQADFDHTDGPAAKQALANAVITWQ